MSKPYADRALRHRVLARSQSTSTRSRATAPSTARDIELMHRTDSVDDAYQWNRRQLAEKALGQPGATL